MSRSVFARRGWFSIAIVAVAIACSAAWQFASAGPVRVAAIALEPGMLNLEQQLVQAFRSSHRGIDIEVVSMDAEDYVAGVTQMLAGPTPPDALLVDTGVIRRLAATGVVVDLWPFIQRNTSLRRNLEKVPVSVRTAFQYRNGTYGIPRSIESVGLVCNAAHFTAAGLQHPSALGASWDWNAFTAYARKLTQAAAPRYGMSFIYEWAHSFWLSFVLSNGGKVFEADGGRVRITDTASMAAFQLLADMGREGIVATPAALRRLRDQIPFLNGRASMLQMYPFGIGAMRRHLDFAMTVAPIPASPYTGRAVSPAAAFGVAVVARSPQRNAAIEWATWLISDEAQALLARSGEVIPSREDYWPLAIETAARAHALQNTDVFVKLFRTGVPDPASPYADSYTLFAVLNQAVAAAVNGELPLETAVRSAESKMNGLLSGRP